MNGLAREVVATAPSARVTARHGVKPVILSCASAKRWAAPASSPAPQGDTLRNVLLSFVMLGLLSACATGRSVVDIRHPASQAEKPAARAFKLTAVDDARVFELEPSEANVPSLKDGDIQNRALTSRAFGRKRGSFGKALGDLVLPEGVSVQSIVREALAAALARSGGVLVSARDPRYAAAIPLQVRIDRFWSWLRPGAWQVQVEFDADVMLLGSTPGMPATQRAFAHSFRRSGMITTSRWVDTVSQGVDLLVDGLAQVFVTMLANPQLASRAPADS